MFCFEPFWGEIAQINHRGHLDKAKLFPSKIKLGNCEPSIMTPTDYGCLTKL